MIYKLQYYDNITMIELLQRHGGPDPFTEWLNDLRDKVAQARIRVRLRQVQAGNFSDCNAVSEGVIELRVHIGAGNHVYCARHRKAVVLLLCA